MMMLAIVMTAIIVYVVFFKSNKGLEHNESTWKTTMATVYTKTENAINFMLRLLRRLHRRLRIRRGAVF